MVSRPLRIRKRGRSCGAGAKRSFSPELAAAPWALPPDGVDRTVIPPISILRAALPVLAACLVWSVASGAQAQTGGQSGAQDNQPAPKTSPAFPRVSVSGSYLAARHAGVSRDAAAAAIYYRSALRGDPRNPELLGRAFMAVLQSGEIDESVRLADRLLQVDKSDRVARLVLGVKAIKQKQYPAARQQLAQSVRGPITDLAAALLTALDLCRPDRKQGRGRHHRQAQRAGVVQSAEGSACRADPRSVRSAA